MGRTRKTDEELKLQGTDKKHKRTADIDWSENYETPCAVMEPIAPPRKYRKETKEAWRKAMALELDRGILSIIDMPLFEMMFDALDMYYLLSAKIQEIIRKCIAEGRNPETVAQAVKYTFKMQNQYIETYHSLAAKFIITPADRRRLGIEIAPKKKTEFQQLLEDMQRTTPYNNPPKTM